MDGYTRKQEIVNGLIHGIGILFGVSGLPVLTGIATSHMNIPGIIGSGIYGFSFLLLFTNSTIYHIARCLPWVSTACLLVFRMQLISVFLAEDSSFKINLKYLLVINRKLAKQ